MTDEPESIAKGKEVLAAMEALTSISHRERRQGLITPAQELNDWLVDAGELDNPYTREGVATLKSQVEVLEKELRDKITLLEAQITRAQADTLLLISAHLLPTAHHSLLTTHYRCMRCSQWWRTTTPASSSGPTVRRTLPLAPTLT